MTELLTALAKADPLTIVALVALALVYALIKWQESRRADKRQERELEETRRLEEAREEGRRDRNESLAQAIGTALAKQSAETLSAMAKQNAEHLEASARDRKELALALSEVIDSRTCSPCQLEGDYKGRIIDLHKVAMATRPDGTYRVHGSAPAEEAAVATSQAVRAQGEQLRTIERDVRDVRDTVKQAS